MTPFVPPAAAPSANGPVVVVEGVWKRFVRNEHRASLRHEAAAMVKRWLLRAAAPPVEPFYALRDVSFTVQHGESVGIVGRNGSGKTTLLKLLSGVTRPTEGRVHVAGRFAALLGLTAGFNTERTGRENIFLNAAIQGAPPRQVRGILDEIVRFAELESFIDTPVKLYSSGMVARLGFSIAVHILPEIIFLDEVLAVGDSAFQEKCIRRILELKAQGRTLLFVSHSREQVTLLCERTLWLHNGRLAADGPSADVLAEYDRAIHSAPENV